jgi:arginyl-tRNA synthetase
MRNLVESLGNELHQAVGGGNLPVPRPVPAQKPEFGDLQVSSAMQLAKPLGKKPREVAEILKRAADEHPAIAKSEIAGPGFLNLWLKDEWLARRADEVRADPRLGLPAPQSRGTVVLDYSSPNAAKPMHIGHLRSTIIGDAIRRTLTAAGYTVVPVNHLGDWGTQFGKLIVAWRKWLDQKAYEQDPVGELLRLYIKFNDEDKAQRGDQKPAEGEEADDDVKIVTPLLAEARAELVKLQKGDAENFALWKQFIGVSIGEFQRVYRRLGVNFTDDDFMGESFYNDRLPAVVEELKEKGIAEPSQGAIVVFYKKPDGTDEMTPSIIQKSDGGFGYDVTDVAALEYRNQRWKPDRIIVVTDDRQQLHFKQLILTGKRLGYSNLEHVWFGLMRLPEGTISTRSGTLISLESLLDEAEKRAYDLAVEVQKKRQENGDTDLLSEEELQKVARVVGIGSVKYNDLSRDRQTLVTFTWDKALALQGNTAPYLQYAYARIRSILRKSGSQPGPIAALQPIERDLVKKVLWFPTIVDAVAESLRPHQLAEYLFDLANTLSTFYSEVKVLVEDAELRASRLAICDLVGRTLQMGLNLLGIDVLERM